MPNLLIPGLLIASLLLSGCVSAPLTPIPSLSYRIDASKPQRNLLVLLRGFGADNTVFEEEGIIDEIRKGGLPFDVIAPDTHYGYYKTETIEVRLKQDIIDPARMQGYKEIWLAGFSMGGLGCLFYVRSYPHDINGVLLTSPYLGGSSIHREIRKVGTIADWKQTSDNPQDWERMLWSWIKHYDPATATPIWLGYGNNDILTSDGPPLLATILPTERIFSVPGNHTIATFKTIFLRHLDTLKERERTP